MAAQEICDWCGQTEPTIKLRDRKIEYQSDYAKIDLHDECYIKLRNILDGEHERVRTELPKIVQKAFDIHNYFSR